MSDTPPRLFLFSDCRSDALTGRWRFVLRGADGSQRLTAEDTEPHLHGERLELLSVVRGLESLEQPSCVTLMTACTYVREGVRHGVAQWKANGWRWERFGQMVPVKDVDLWQRVDRAMQYHQIDCRTYRFDSPHRGRHVDRPLRGRNNSSRRDASGCATTRKRNRPKKWLSIRRGLQYCLGRIASLGWRRPMDAAR